MMDLLLSLVPRKTKLALPPFSGVNDVQAYGVLERLSKILDESPSFSAWERDIVDEDF
jgi:hypothetical protein